MAMTAIVAFIYNIFKTYNQIRIAARIHRFKTYVLFDSDVEFESEEAPLISSSNSSSLESNRVSIGFGGSGYDIRSEARTR